MTRPLMLLVSARSLLPFHAMHLVHFFISLTRTVDAYLGTQGDVWDAQMDISCAAIGALICMITTAMMRKVFHKGAMMLVGDKHTAE